MITIKEHIDYLFGGVMLISAPFVPIICDIDNVMLEDAEHILTILIQFASLVLIGVRIKKNLNDNDSKET